MRWHPVILLAAGITTSAVAGPFVPGDPAEGRKLVEKHCIACHAARFGGDGSAIYTRENRRIKDAAGLLAQIRTCNTNLGLKWFEDEERHVASHLDAAYYHFDKRAP